MATYKGLGSTSFKKDTAQPNMSATTNTLDTATLVGPDITGPVSLASSRPPTESTYRNNLRSSRARHRRNQNEITTPSTRPRQRTHSSNDWTQSHLAPRHRRPTSARNSPHLNRATEVPASLHNQRVTQLPSSAIECRVITSRDDPFLTSAIPSTPTRIYPPHQNGRLRRSYPVNFQNPPESPTQQRSSRRMMAPFDPSCSDWDASSSHSSVDLPIQGATRSSWPSHVNGGPLQVSAKVVFEHGMDQLEMIGSPGTG